MKCLVAVKQVIDPYVKIRVKNDNSAVETSNVKMAINPFDEIALEEAIKQKEAGVITEIIAISIGSLSCQEILRQALARGADQAMLIETEQSLTPISIAKILAAITKYLQPEIIMLGKQAIDDDCNQTGQMLAALLGWAQATFASKVVFDTTRKTVQVSREIDGGQQTLELTLPTIITCDLRLNEPRYISLPKLMQAKTKTLIIKPLSELELTLVENIKIIKTTAPLQHRTCITVLSVTELVTKLRNEARVI